MARLDGSGYNTDYYATTDYGCITGAASSDRLTQSYNNSFAYMLRAYGLESNIKASC